MRIMLDTNVLISGFAFHSRAIMNMIRWIGEAHELILCSYVVDELREVIARKAPALMDAANAFLRRLPFEMYDSPALLPEPLPFEIRDPDDAVVLYSAIEAQADILITGDKDFANVAVGKPEIMTPSEFIQKYIM